MRAAFEHPAELGHAHGARYAVARRTLAKMERAERQSRRRALAESQLCLALVFGPTPDDGRAPLNPARMEPLARASRVTVSWPFGGLRRERFAPIPEPIGPPPSLPPVRLWLEDWAQNETHRVTVQPDGNAMTPTDLPHGTRARAWLGCPCEACSRAATAA